VAVKVKICGITRVDDAIAAAELGADLIGLNFYRRSPRFVELETARAIGTAVRGRVILVGVFVNAPREEVEKLQHELGLDMLQFHGDEGESALAGWPVPVIRAWRIRPGMRVAWESRPKADYVLLDSYDERLFGGTGRALPKLDLRGFELDRTIISGGLRVETVASAAALGPWAVDVASGVERAPGIKDYAKIRDFILNAKSA